MHKLEQKDDVIWVVDCTFPIPTDKPLLLLLNTLCYERESKAFFSGWKELCVLSDFEKDQVICSCDGVDHIHKVTFYIDEILYQRPSVRASGTVHEDIYQLRCRLKIHPVLATSRRRKGGQDSDLCIAKISANR